MKLPGFTADDSLYRSGTSYRPGAGAGVPASGVRPAQFVGFPIPNIEICPGGSVNVCLRRCARQCAVNPDPNCSFLCGFRCRFLCGE